MSLPSNFIKDRLRGQTQQTGVILGIPASTNISPYFSVELQRADGTSSAASTSFSVLTQMPNADLQARANLYTDTIPLSDLIYSYRARMVRDGWTASTWTPTVSARPVVLPMWVPQNPKARATLYHSSAQQLNAGSVYYVKWTPRTNVGSMFTTAAPSSGTRLTPPFTDTYVVQAVIPYSSAYRGSTSPSVPFSFVLSGTTAIAYDQVYLDSTVPKTGSVTLVGNVDLKAADYVHVVISAPSGPGIGGTIQIEGSTGGSAHATLSMTRVTQ